MSLSNLRREVWKDLPVLEDLYQVSSHGRIKSLPRLREIADPRSKVTRTYWTKERIRKIKVHEKWNSVVDQAYFECTVSLSLSGGARAFIVHRLVYQAFVKDIDFEADRLMVMHKDNDGLNNHYNNLIAGTKHDVLKKAYRRKRQISPFALKTKKEFKEIAQRAALTRQKKIIQYSLEGKRLRIFDSIKKASLHTGIADSNIVVVLKGHNLTAGGFVWRYYPGRKKINTEHIRKRKKSKLAQSWKAVQQFSPEGKLLRTFRSIAEASAKTGISSSGISNCLAGRVKRIFGYIFRPKM